MSQRLNEIRNERIAIADERAKVEADWKENGDDFGEEPEALKKRAEYQAKLPRFAKKNWTITNDWSGTSTIKTLSRLSRKSAWSFVPLFGMRVCHEVEPAH